MTPESKRLLNDRVSASQVEVLLLEGFPRVEVTASNGEMFIRPHSGLAIHKLLSAKQIIE
jgi:hypothetical protein